MSLTMPTGTVTTLTTGTITRQFGTYQMEIVFNSPSSLSTTMKLSKMPSIKQDMDLQIEFSDISEIKMNLTDIEFTVFDGLGDGNSLIDKISALGVGDAIRIKSTINTGGTDYFLATRSTCTYDWESRTVTIKGTSPFRYDNVITSYDPSAYELTSGGSDSWILPRDLIKSFLKSQGDNPNAFIVGSFFEDTATGGDTGLGNQYGFQYDYVDTGDYLRAQDTVLKLSVMEGAVVGCAKGDAFYVRRNYTGTSIPDFALIDPYTTINADDIESYELLTNERSIRNYDTVFFFEDQHNQPTVGTYTITDEVSAFGAYDVNLDYRFLKASPPSIDTIVKDSISGNWGTLASGTSNTLINILNVHARDNARKSYASALGIHQSYGLGGSDPDVEYNNMFTMSLTFFGINNFRAFQYILFGNDINPFVNGRKLRPSSFEYNLEQNKVKVKGYFIG